MVGENKKRGYFMMLPAKFGRRHRLKKNLRQLAVSIGVGLEIKSDGGILTTWYDGEFTGSEEAVQRFRDAIAVWHPKPGT